MSRNFSFIYDLKGYDAVYIASRLAYTTVGLDLSPKAVEAAKQCVTLKSNHAVGQQNLRYADSTQTEKENKIDVSFHSGDFFTYKVNQDEQFDLVYDYT